MRPQAPNFGVSLALRNEQSSECWQSEAVVPQSGLTAELVRLTCREITEFVGFKSKL